jgi:(S)-ureidoglycine aminohydrolase
MPELFGHTRARVAARHALLTPSNHVASSLPEVQGGTSIVLINPAMGARFAQIQIALPPGSSATWPSNELQTFGYVMSGGGHLHLGPQGAAVQAGHYFFAPAGIGWHLHGTSEGTQLMLFQKRYEPRVDVPAPPALIRHVDDVIGTPFLGDPAADLKVLLPDDTRHDMAVNLFSYQPGGHLPFVEIHVMEHGLVMLGGQGVYRLEDSWYPVETGDVIWMGPYCPQWFVAMGKTPAKYLYYKDVNRSGI